MRHLFTTLIICFSFSLFSQDTTVVQTFDWDSDTRAATFQFPDDPTESYRKIWMRYNMRCHDNEVGNGAVGCREWDYSCNTFITDPSRVDSTQQMHPNYIISNFSGNVFDYTSEPTYSYFQYDQHQTTLVGDGAIFQIGLGEANLQLANGQEVVKSQFLYTAEELQNAGAMAGDISGLQMEVTNFGTEIGFFRIWMKNTSKVELSADDVDNEGFTEVYFSNTAFESTGSKDFNFYAPFEWDGTSNVLMEINFTTVPDGETAGVSGEGTDFTASIFSSEKDNALHFTGTGGVDVPTEDFTTISDEVTISLWTFGNADVLPVNTYAFEGLDSDNNRQVSVHLPWSNGQIYWDCGNDGGGYDRINKTATTAEMEGQWNHWAFTKNATTGDMKIFLNGELWHSGTGKFKQIDIQSLVIGASANFVTQYHGSLDEFRVWNKELDAETIQNWMSKKVDNSHPFYENLLTYYRMDEGEGFVLNDETANENHAQISLPNWQKIRGKDLYKNFIESPMRPNIGLLQGDYVINDEVISVIDSIQNGVNQVVEYEVIGTDLIIADTQFVYGSGYQYVINENGEIVDSILVNTEGSLTIDELTYYDKRDAKFEILSLVTPYGNGLSLGADGKTFVFDVTDYAPILKGEKYMSIEMGGQWQEELDIEFIYVKGTPEREVMNIQNIWPFRRGWFADIQNDRFFEPRAVTLDENGTMFKIRSAITGHGQNGEFVPRQHYINLDGGAQDFQYDVWKYCGKNPIYPQGGTWIFDRAGWCPGEATDVHEFNITGNPGDVVEIDYGVNGAFMDAANYLVSNQLATYGAYNYETDASIESVIRPNNWQVQYERINPACNTPTLLVRNSGANEITSIEIEYNVLGGVVLTHTWTGNLASSENVEIILPLSDYNFWNAPGEQLFEVEIKSVNGAADENADNNFVQTPYESATVFETTDPLSLQVNTNLVAGDNSYTIKDSEGNVVMERDNMQNTTLYTDEINLPPGCYTFNFEDTGNDGLQFWFFPENGSGSLKFSRLFNGSIQLPIKSFLPDHGGGIQFDFIRPFSVDTENLEYYQLFSVYPNPTSDVVTIELHGFENENFQLELLDLTGKVIRSENIDTQSNIEYLKSINLAGMPKGMYYLRVQNEKKVWVREVVLTD